MIARFRAALAACVVALCAFHSLGAGAQSAHRAAEPAAPPDIHITRYRHTRFHAIYLNGNLLAVTVYKKGALAIRDLLQSQRADAKP